MTALAHNNRRPFLTRHCPDATVALSGKLSVTPLLSICSTLEANGKTALVRVLTEDGPGHLWFREGVLLDAEFDGAGGEGALCRILALEEGRFQVLYTVVDRPRTINASPNAVAQRRKARTSEWTRLLAQGPSLDTVLHQTEESMGHTPLLQSQQALLPYVDGEKSVSEVIEEVGGDAIETLRDVVALVELGVLSEQHAKSAIRESSPIARLDTPIPRAPAVPRFDYPPVLAPPAESEAAEAGVEPARTATEETGVEEAASRYSDRPGTVEVIRVPDNVRPSSVPPSPNTEVPSTARLGTDLEVTGPDGLFLGLDRTSRSSSRR